MIYIRNYKIYNDLLSYLKDYPKFNYRIKAFYRILNNRLNKEPLKNYPDIDIYLEIKNNKRCGRFTNKLLSFYKRINKDPYIILYISTHYILKNQVKNFIDTIYHEFIHYKHWLNNDRLKHNKDFKRKGIGDINKYIEALKLSEVKND